MMIIIIMVIIMAIIIIRVIIMIITMGGQGACARVILVLREMHLECVLGLACPPSF